MVEELKYLNSKINAFKKKYSADDTIYKYLEIDTENAIFGEEIPESFDESIPEEKRRKTGSFYTPEYIAEAIIKRSLLQYSQNNFSGEIDALKDVIFHQKVTITSQKKKAFIQMLEEIKIVDLSVGSGIFVLKYLDIIKKIFITLGCDNLRKRFKKIIEENIYAYDINLMAISVLKLEINDFYWQLGGEQLLSINIYNKNSIIDTDISQLNGTFDIVLGNPPYLGEKGNREVFQKILKSTFGKKYYNGKMDLMYYFVYRGIELLDKNGVLGYITSNYFTTADHGKKLRAFLREEGSFCEIVNFHDNKVFQSAPGLHSMMFLYSKIKSDTIRVHNITDNLSEEALKSVVLDPKSTKYFYPLELAELFGEHNKINLYYNANHLSIINKIIRQSCYKLDSCFNVNQGIISGADKVTNYILKNKISDPTIQTNNLKKDMGIFVLNHREIGAFKSKKYLKKFYKNSDITKFSINEETEKYILYIDEETLLDKELEGHLYRFKEALMKRREIKKGLRPWHALQWPRERHIFEKEKIIVPQRSIQNTFGYTEEPFYGSADIYYITQKSNLFNYSMKVLLGLLNSKLLYFYLYNMGKKKGKYLELYATPLKRIPLKQMMNVDEILTLVDQLIAGYTEDTFNELNEIIYDEYNITDDEKITIENFYREKCYE